jgi:assimilatory nitrate reductase catalytic subunit
MPIMFEDAFAATSPRKASRQGLDAMATTRTTCPYCGVGCGVLVSPGHDAQPARVRGDPDHPANYGRLCSKGSALGETLGLEGRLLFPMQKQADESYRPVSWSAALDRIATGFRDIIERHGANAVAIYLSGQLLTEDYYVANKLMKGFLGSSNVDTNSRLCMASTVAGHRRAFGADTVPGCYEDLDQADLVVLVGSNAAWCHPVLFQRIVRNRTERGAKLVVIDTRRTTTAESADLFLEIAPGSDQALFGGLLVYLEKFGAFDAEYIRAHTRGLPDALEAARAIAPSIRETALATGLRETDVVSFFDLFARTPRTVTAFSQGVNQSAQGTDKVNAILNCHLATGRIGRIGASPFSLTGQPNAMGGREVGGLANSLAAHMGFDADSVDRVRRFWNAPNMAVTEGRKAVDMFDAVARGEIKALWVAGTNPAASLPNADAARSALDRLDLFVVSDNVSSNDTIRSRPHFLLPAEAWGEKNGTVTNSERRISRQRAFRPAPGKARADWDIFADFARRMGFDGFDFASAADVFREHAALSTFENAGSRDFDIGGLADLDDDEYDGLAPTQWPIRASDRSGTARLFEGGGFFTGDRKAAFVAPARPALAAPLSPAFPLRLNTGRIRDQWHTMTRTGTSPRLCRHLPEPFVEVNPVDAKRLGVEDGGFARVTTEYGACVLRAVVIDRQPEGSIFTPIHWTDETASSARVGALVAPVVDPFSGQPESKATPATIAPASFARGGFLLSRREMAFDGRVWWSRSAIADGYGYRIATDLSDDEWLASIRPRADAEVVEFIDETAGVSRGAAFRAARAEFIWALAPAAPDWEFELEQLSREHASAADRFALVAGRRDAAADDEGALVCACFGVGARRIETLARQGLRSAADIGSACKAGSNCGSCLPEIRRILDAVARS